MSRLLPALIGAALAGAALTFVLTREGDKAPEVSADPPAIVADPASAPVPPALLSVVEPTAVPIDPEHSIQLPDGTWVPTLNQVANAPEFHWTVGRPYAPIIGIRRKDPWDWYEHSDGTFSTTVLRYRADLGRMDATTLVLHPNDPVPKVDGEGAVVDGQR